MILDITTIVLAMLGAGGIGFTWYLKVRPQGEQLNWYKLLQSALFGALSGAIITVLGVTVSDTSVVEMMTSTGMIAFIGDPTTIITLVSGIATALLGGSGGLVIENIWKALGLTTIAAASTTVVVKPAVVVTVPDVTVPDVPAKTDVYDPAKNGGKLSIYMTWEETAEFVTFKMDDVTRGNLLDGITSQADILAINTQIAAAEAANRYRYTITYSGGFYTIQYMITPVDAYGKVRYRAILSQSGTGGKT
jgi:hypothetical protein